MFLILEGTGWHKRGGVEIPLRAGHLVFVQPEDAHNFSTGPRESLDFVNVAVSSRWIKNLTVVLDLPTGWQSAGHPPGHFLVERDMQKRLRQLMFRLMEPNREVDALIAAWVCAIQGATPKPTSPEVPPPWLELLHRDLQRPEWMEQNLAFWQKRSGRSPEHLARSCRRFYGVPLSELVNRARIGHAQLLLQTRDEKITTVAFAAGYNNLAHFYRVFARIVGVTPDVWRRQASKRVVPGI